jgi:hypothetical protein
VRLEGLCGRAQLKKAWRNLAYHFGRKEANNVR